MKSKQDYTVDRLANEILNRQKPDKDAYQLTSLLNEICNLRYLIANSNQDSYLAQKWIYSLIERQDKFKALYDKVYANPLKLPVRDYKIMRDSI